MPELIKEEDIPAIIAFDKLAFGADRSVLIRYLITNFPGKSWFIRRNNKIAGYVLGRTGNRYHRIGPLSTASPAEAKILMRHALDQLSGLPVVIDVLHDKIDLISYLSAAGFTEKRYFIRMFRHNNPYPGRRDLLHVIAGPEFG